MSKTIMPSEISKLKEATMVLEIHSFRLKRSTGEMQYRELCKLLSFATEALDIARKLENHEPRKY